MKNKAGRPRLSEERKKMAAYRLDVEALEQLERKAAAAKLPKAQVIEQAIRQWYPPMPVPKAVAQLRSDFLSDCLRRLVDYTGTNAIAMSVLVNASGVSEHLVRAHFAGQCGVDYVLYRE